MLCCGCRIDWIAQYFRGSHGSIDSIIHHGPGSRLNDAIPDAAAVRAGLVLGGLIGGFDGRGVHSLSREPGPGRVSLLCILCCMIDSRFLNTTRCISINSPTHDVPSPLHHPPNHQSNPSFRSHHLQNTRLRSPTPLTNSPSNNPITTTNIPIPASPRSTSVSSLPPPEPRHFPTVYAVLG